MYANEIDKTVVYPLTFYPGVSDASAASQIALSAGEQRIADFNLMALAESDFQSLDDRSRCWRAKP